MKRVELTSEWLANWKPTKRTDIADKGRTGLEVRGGPTGTKTFYRFANELVPETGKWRRKRVKIGCWPAVTLDQARRAVGGRADADRASNYTRTVGDLLDLYIERGQVSDYTADVLRTHLKGIRAQVAATLAPDALPDLVAKVQAGYELDGKRVGGPAVADKVRSGLSSLFAWAQRQGKYPEERRLPTLGLIREDFKGIGWAARERVPSEGELHRLFDALGIGSGPELEIDLEVSPRIPLVTRLAVLLTMHVPVRSGVGILSQPASAANCQGMVLRWETHKGQRHEEIETPLSTVAKGIVERLRDLPGGETWLVPSPEAPEPGKPWQHIDVKALARLFARLQTPGANGAAPRVAPDKGQEPLVPHTLRALWSSLAGDYGVEDGVSVRVIGHKPTGASAAHGFYDRSQRTDRKREAVELISGELERIRRREPRKAVVVPLREAVRAATGEA